MNVVEECIGEVKVRIENIIGNKPKTTQKIKMSPKRVKASAKPVSMKIKAKPAKKVTKCVRCSCGGKRGTPNLGKDEDIIDVTKGVVKTGVAVIGATALLGAFGGMMGNQ